MKVSVRGLDLIRGFEALRLTAYPDPGAKDGTPWTIGYGHTAGVEEGDTCTDGDALFWLREDLAGAEQCIDDHVEVELTQNQFDALASFVFNLGCLAFRNSTLLRLLNAGNAKGAAGQFSKWNHNNGVVMAGLTRRRKAEADLFQLA